MNMRLVRTLAFVALMGMIGAAACGTFVSAVPLYSAVMEAY